MNTSHSADAQTYVVAFRGSVGAKNFATAFRLRLEALRVTRWVAESPHGVFFSHSPISPICHTPVSLYITTFFLEVLECIEGSSMLRPDSLSRCKKKKCHPQP